MKPFTMISSQTGVCGYREDDWQIIEIIETKKDLYKMLKEGYLTDAFNRNDYPICSFPINISYTRNKLNSTYGVEQIDWEDEEQMDYRDIDNDIELEKQIKIEYKKTFEKFEKWKNKIKTLLPILRELKRKKDKETSEKKQLKELAEKYGYVLAKKVEKKIYWLASFEKEYMIISEKEKELLLNNKNKYVTVEEDSFYTCNNYSYKLYAHSLDITKIKQGIKEFIYDEEMIVNNGFIKELINKCKN